MAPARTSGSEDCIRRISAWVASGCRTSPSPRSASRRIAGTASSSASKSLAPVVAPTGRSASASARMTRIASILTVSLGWLSSGATSSATGSPVEPRPRTPRARMTGSGEPA